jgi:hypothetical protein
VEATGCFGDQLSNWKSTYREILNFALKLMVEKLVGWVDSMNYLELRYECLKMEARRNCYPYILFSYFYYKSGRLINLTDECLSSTADSVQNRHTICCLMTVNFKIHRTIILSDNSMNVKLGLSN